jgi:Transcriptional Coactivator p15 (PC4)
MTSDTSDPIELLRFGDEKAPTVISLSKFKGMRFIDIRRHYFDKTSKTTKPTQKGIALKEDEFGAVADFIVSNMSTLQGLFTADLNAAEVRWKRRQEKKSQVVEALQQLKLHPGRQWSFSM